MTTATSNTMRGNMVVLATTTPMASRRCSCGWVPARREKFRVTAVEETRPPDKAVSTIPRLAPRILMVSALM